MTRDLARMENQMFGGCGSSGIGSMVDRNMRVLPNFIERDGQQLAQFQLDVKGFKPEDITSKLTYCYLHSVAAFSIRGEGPNFGNGSNFVSDVSLWFCVERCAHVSKRHSRSLNRFPTRSHSSYCILYQRISDSEYCMYSIIQYLVLISCFSSQNR